MDEQDLTRFVISQLSQDVRRNDIVQKVCERGKISWAQAQAFVDQIENSQQAPILYQRQRLFLIVSATLMLEGIVQTIWAANLLIEQIGEVSSAQDAWEVIVGVPLTLYFVLPAMLAGIGFIIGGAFNVGRMISRMKRNKQNGSK